ncbi:MAG: hypothetical protein ACREUW_03620 [Burkholderiales bacterium]
MEPDSDRIADITKIARQMAASGQYFGWQEIEKKLVSDGFKDASAALTDESLRDDLNATCQNASMRMKWGMPKPSP